MLPLLPLLLLEPPGLLLLWLLQADWPAPTLFASQWNCSKQRLSALTSAVGLTTNSRVTPTSVFASCVPYQLPGPWRGTGPWSGGGHEPRVYAAVCFWLCRWSGGHQLCCTGLSVSAAAGSLLCLYWRLTCPASLALPAQTQQVQHVCCVRPRVWMLISL